MKSVLNIHWKDGCRSWHSSTLATWCENLTHWKRPWCWERLKAGGEGDNRGWDGWMASPTQWTWVWASSRSCWWTGKPGVLQPMGSQRVRHDWATEVNWTFAVLLSPVIRSSTLFPYLSSLFLISYTYSSCMLSHFNPVWLCDPMPMHCSLSGYSVHGILQTRILEWVAVPSSRGSSWRRNQTSISWI